MPYLAAPGSVLGAVSFLGMRRERSTSTPGIFARARECDPLALDPNQRQDCFVIGMKCRACPAPAKASSRTGLCPRCLGRQLRNGSPTAVPIPREKVTRITKDLRRTLGRLRNQDLLDREIDRAWRKFAGSAGGHVRSALDLSEGMTGALEGLSKGITRYSIAAAEEAGKLFNLPDQGRRRKVALAVIAVLIADRDGLHPYANVRERTISMAKVARSVAGISTTGPMIDYRGRRVNRERVLNHRAAHWLGSWLTKAFGPLYNALMVARRKAEKRDAEAAEALQADLDQAAEGAAAARRAGIGRPTKAVWDARALEAPKTAREASLKLVDAAKRSGLAEARPKAAIAMYFDQRKRQLVTVHADGSRTMEAKEI